jgi:hypothetical protein
MMRKLPLLMAVPVLLQARGALAQARKSEAHISIVPQAARVCPGDPIGAKYIGHFPDGTQSELSASDVKQISTSDAAATMGRDGNWQTSTNPMASVLTGFRLSVTLARDTSIRGDTVVAPAIDCFHPDVKLSPSGRFQTTHAYVRLGTFPTPFYDSVVVAVVEVESRALTVRVLTPSEMRSGTIKVSAVGANGANGRSGRPAARAVTDCSNGDDGEDGDPGEPGQPGGQVDIITEQGSPWLAKLVTVINRGGRGGNGGAGSAGQHVSGIPAGAPSGPATSGTSRTGQAVCRARDGRPGRNGHQGADGAAGPEPNVTSVLQQLLWNGSPIWSDSTAKRALEGLTAYRLKRGG